MLDGETTCPSYTNKKLSLEFDDRNFKIRSVLCLPIPSDKHDQASDYPFIHQKKIYPKYYVNIH